MEGLRRISALVVANPSSSCSRPATRGGTTGKVGHTMASNRCHSARLLDHRRVRLQ